MLPARSNLCTGTKLFDNGQLVKIELCEIESLTVCVCMLGFFLLRFAVQLPGAPIHGTTRVEG